MTYIDLLESKSWLLEVELLPHRIKRAYPSLTPQAVTILALLVRTPGEVSFWLMCDRLKRPRSGKSDGVVRVHLSDIRKQIGRDSIVYTGGAYYALTPEGRALVLDAIEAVSMAPLSPAWRTHEQGE